MGCCSCPVFWPQLHDPPAQTTLSLWQNFASSGGIACGGAAWPDILLMITPCERYLLKLKLTVLACIVQANHLPTPGHPNPVATFLELEIKGSGHAQVALQPWPTLVGMKSLIDYTTEYKVGVIYFHADRFCRYQNENIADWATHQTACSGLG